jgi:hypothetical protein
MPFLKKKQVVYVAVETAEGTENTGGTLDFLVEDLNFKPEPAFADRNVTRTYHGRKASPIATKLARITFRTEVKGWDYGTHDGYGALFAACGFKETIVAGTSATYNIVTVGGSTPYSNTKATGNTTVTIYAFEDGIRKTATSCRGTFQITAEAGNLAYIDWEFLGLWEASTDVVFPSEFALDSTVAPVVESAALNLQSIGAANLCYRSFSITLGNALNPRFDANSAGGVKGIMFSDRECVGAVDPESQLEATLTTSFEDRLMGTAAGGAPITGTFTAQIGTETDNTCTISTPSGAIVQIMDSTEAERDGVSTRQINFAFKMPDDESTATDEEIQIVFT